MDEAKRDVEQFTLTACRLLKDSFVPQRGAEPATYTWKELANALAPTRSRAALQNLRRLHPGAFIGLIDHPCGQVRNFLFYNHNGSRNARWFLRRAPAFRKALREVYRVESVQYSGSVTEDWSSYRGGTARA